MKTVKHVCPRFRCVSYQIFFRRRGCFQQSLLRKWSTGYIQITHSVNSEVIKEWRAVGTLKNGRCEIIKENARCEYIKQNGRCEYIKQNGRCEYIKQNGRSECSKHKIGNVHIAYLWGAFMQPLLQWKRKKYYTTLVCVFVAPGIQHAMCMRHVFICDLPRCTNFFPIIS